MSKDAIKEWWNGVLSWIGKIVGPRYSCYVCGRELENPEYPICKNCKGDMDKIGTRVCLKCGTPVNGDTQYCLECYGKSRDFDMARACYVYNSASSKIVSDLKYKKKQYVAKYMAEEMSSRITDFGVMPDIIVPVPITEKRLNKRGFNQSEIIAKELVSLLGGGVVVRKDLVFRDVDRLPQAGLSRVERLTNLKGVFSVNTSQRLTGKTVLVIDDVFTTGSTVGEVVKQLRKLKPKKVYVLTFAKTVENK